MTKFYRTILYMLVLAISFTGCNRVDTPEYTVTVKDEEVSDCLLNTPRFFTSGNYYNIKDYRGTTLVITENCPRDVDIGVAVQTNAVYVADISGWQTEMIYHTEKDDVIVQDAVYAGGVLYVLELDLNSENVNIYSFDGYNKTCIAENTGYISGQYSIHTGGMVRCGDNVYYEYMDWSADLRTYRIMSVDGTELYSKKLLSYEDIKPGMQVYLDRMVLFYLTDKNSSCDYMYKVDEAGQETVQSMYGDSCVAVGDKTLYVTKGAEESFALGLYDSSGNQLTSMDFDGAGRLVPADENSGCLIIYSYITDPVYHLYSYTVNVDSLILQPVYIPAVGNFRSVNLNESGELAVLSYEYYADKSRQVIYTCGKISG